MVSVKIACRNPSKVPLERLFEMKKKLYAIAFTMEGDHLSTQEPGDPDESRGNDDNKNDDEADDLDDQNDNSNMETDYRTSDPLGK